MYDDLVVRIYGKLPAKFLLGTSTVIEKQRLMWYFLFLARETIRICLVYDQHFYGGQGWWMGRGVPVKDALSGVVGS